MHLIWKLLIPLVFAAQSITVSSVPATLDEKSEIEIIVDLSCPSCSTDSYLRAVFYPSGTSYFGFTQNNDGVWVNAPAGSCTQYFKVLQSDMSKEGTWSGTLKVKPDTENTYYKGPGEYVFKVGRYTPSCSSASVWSSESTIAITGPTHTPTPVPSNTPAPTDKPNPTSTNTPLPTLTNTPTIIPTPQPEADRPLAEFPTEVFLPDILGESTAIPTIAETTKSASARSQSPFVFALLCIGSGFGLLATALALKKTELWKNYVDR